MKGIISDFPFAIYVKELCAVNGIGKGPNLPLATGSVKVISKTLQAILLWIGLVKIFNISSLQLPLLRLFLHLQIFIYLEEFGNVTYRGDRGVDLIENIRVGEFSDISRVGVLEDYLLLRNHFKIWRGTNLLDWRGGRYSVMIHKAKVKWGICFLCGLKQHNFWFGWIYAKGPYFSVL